MKFYRRIAHYLWITSASLILMLAVMVGLARALLPYLDYRASIEARVSAYLGQPVSIERLDARLLGLTPSIILRKVTLKSISADAPIARFDEIHIGVDLYGSLRARSLVLSELTMVGGRLTVIRRKDGTFSVEGVAASQAIETTQESASFGEWLLSQGRLAVRDSALLWRDELRRRSLNFDHVDLELVNSGERHRLNGSVLLPKGSGKSLRISVDLHGNPLAGMEWGGKAYAKTEELQPLYWLSLFDTGLPKLALKSGELTAEIWSEWHQGVAVRSEGDFLLRQARLQSAKRPTALIKELSGEWLWQRHDEGWDLDIQGMQLSLNKGEEGTSRLRVSHRSTGDLLLVDRLKLDDLAVVALHIPVLSEKQVQQLQSLAPRGEVRRLRLERLAEGGITSQGEFHALGINAWEYVPGFIGATGRWRADGQGGEIYLDSRAVYFDAPRLFRAPMQIDSLAAVLAFRPMEEGWRLEGRNISASNADITARGELDMQFEPELKPYLDLRFDFQNAAVKQVPRYIPARIMGDTVVSWLDGAFDSGIARRGTVLFHGRTIDFPFENSQGVFETRFQAEEVGLTFERDWPRLSNVSGEVLFDNQGMVITPRSGKLFSTDIEQASVTIADFNAPLLDVAIKAAPPVEDVLRMLRETPLAHHVGDALSDMVASGRSELQLQLRIPLSAPMAEKTPLIYQGVINLEDARLQVWDGVVFRQLDGAVYFSDSGFHSTALQGELLDAPVILEIKTDDAARTLVTAHGRLMADAVRRDVKLPLLEHLQGESDWRGLLFLPRGEGSHPSLEIHSSLEGMAVQLPAPVGKEEREAVSLAVRVAFGEERAKRVSISYGERISARFAVGGEGSVLQRAALRFGPGAIEMPDVGWRIGGTLEKLDWSRWHSLLPSGSGQTQLPMTIDMERLSLLPMAESDRGDGSLKPESLPQLDLHIRDFSYDGWNLGELTGSSRSDSQRWEMPDLHFVGAHHDIHLAARWREGQRSQLEFTSTSDNIESMLHDFGLATIISTGNGTISGKLQWAGMLSDLSWKVFDGSIALEIKDGALVEVEPGAGRLFGLLSLQALPRRLLLDFRDLFQKGMTFDEIKGTIRVSNGDAKTDNFYIKSPSAGILVEGRTGLVQRDYDHTISVVPNVSSSVSIASAIAWGPQVAAAVLLFQNIFKKDIAKATMIRYSVKGSWDDPQITRLNQPGPAASVVSE